MNAVGNAGREADIIVGDPGGVRQRVHLHQRGRGVAHAGEVQLSVELDNHAVAGKRIPVSGEYLIVAPMIGLPEDDLGFAGLFADSNDDRPPSVYLGFIKLVHAEHHFDDLLRSLVGVEGGGQGAGFLHPVQRGLDVVVVNIEGGIVASTDVDILAVLSAVRHGPGIGIAAILILAGQNGVDLACAPRGMGDLVDGIAALGEFPLLDRLVADVALAVPDDLGPACCGKKCQQQRAAQQNSHPFHELLLHFPYLIVRVYRVE